MPLKLFTHQPADFSAAVLPVQRTYEDALAGLSDLHGVWVADDYQLPSGAPARWAPRRGSLVLENANQLRAPQISSRDGLAVASFPDAYSAFLAPAALPAVTGRITFGMRVYLRSVAAGDNYLFDGYVSKLTAYGPDRWDYSPGVGVVSAAVAPTVGWHTVMLVQDADTHATLYLDGQAFQLTPTQAFAATSNFILGVRQSSTKAMKADVRAVILAFGAPAATADVPLLLSYLASA